MVSHFVSLSLLPGNVKMGGDMKTLCGVTVILACSFILGCFWMEAEAKGGSGTGSNSKSYSVKPFVRKDGSYIKTHRNTVPNKTDRDNFSTKGNYNPYTGTTGTRSPSKW
jgi:hypothetical protein